MGLIQFGIIATLLFSLLIAFFALANNQPVLVNYLFGQAEISVIFVIIGSAALGALAIGILSLAWRVRVGFRFREYERKLEVLSTRAESLEKELDQALVKLKGYNDDNGTVENTAEAKEKTITKQTNFFAEKEDI
ncbi:MAG: LapA family protein [Dethiobacteria bacterium]